MRFYFKILSILISMNGTILYAASLDNESINSSSIKSIFSISDINYKNKNSNNFDNRKISSSSTSCNTVKTISNKVTRGKLFNKAFLGNKKIVKNAVNIYYELDDYQRNDYCVSEELQKDIFNEIDDFK